MSGKPKNRPRQIGLPAPRIPRTIAQIQDEFNKIALEAGQAQYHVYVYTNDVKEKNEKMRDLNMEAAERNRLDAEAAKKEAPSEQPA